MSKVNLKRQIVKRLTAVGVALSLIIGSMYIPASNAVVVEAASTEQAATSTEQAATVLKQESKLKKAATGVLTALGKKVATKVATKIGNEIDEATGTHKGSKIASMVASLFEDKTEAMLEEIKSLCNQIISELDAVEEKIDSTTTKIEKMIATQAASDALSRLDEKWKDCVPQDTAVKNALEAFKDYMNKATTYRNLVDEEAHQYDIRQAKAAYETAMQNYKAALVRIYVLKNGALKSEEDLYTSFYVNSAIANELSNLIDEILPAPNQYAYVERAAQVAYMTMPFSGDQYDYVDSELNRQLYEIIYLELMYEDFLDAQGDFIDSYEGEEETLAKLNRDYNAALILFGRQNNSFAENTVALMSTGLRFNPASTGATIKLTDYMKSYDEREVTLANRSMGDLLGKKNYAYRFKLKGIITEEGKVKPYWFLSPSEKTRAGDLEKQWDARVSDYMDYVILTGSTWGNTALKPDKTVHLTHQDGTKEVSTELENLTKLFSGNAFSMAGNVPADYLKEWDEDLLGPVKDSKKKYVLVAGGDGDNYNILDLNKQQSGTTISATDWSMFDCRHADADVPYTLILSESAFDSYIVRYGASAQYVRIHSDNSTIEDAEQHGGEMIRLSFAGHPGGLSYNDPAKIPVKVIAHYYDVDPDQGDWYYGNQKRIDNTDKTYTLFDYEDIQNIEYDGNYYNIEIPTPFTTDVQYEVVYEDAVSEVYDMDIEGSEDASSVRITGKFERAYGGGVAGKATGVEFEFATDSAFENIVATRQVEATDKFDVTYTAEDLGISGRVYVRAKGYDIRPYGADGGDFTVYSKYATKAHVDLLEIPKISLETTDKIDALQAVVSPVAGADGIELQLSESYTSFDENNILTEKTIDAGGGTVTFESLEIDKSYYLRARSFATVVSEEAGDGTGTPAEVTLESGWTSEDLHTHTWTSLPKGHIQKAVVCSPSAVEITSESYTDDASVRKLKFVAAVSLRRDDPQNQEKIIEGNDSATWRFEGLAPIEWDFGVHPIGVDGADVEHTGNISNTICLDLTPHSSIENLKRKTATSFVITGSKDYSSVGYEWSVYRDKNYQEVIKQGKSDTADVTVGGIDPEETPAVYVRWRSYAIDPGTGEKVYGKYSEASLNMLPIATIAYAQAVDEGNIRVIMQGRDNPCGGYRYELYQGNTLKYTGESAIGYYKFTDVDEGKYTLKVSAYTQQGDQRYYGEPAKIDIAYCPPAKFEAELLSFPRKGYDKFAAIYTTEPGGTEDTVAFQLSDDPDNFDGRPEFISFKYIAGEYYGLAVFPVDTRKTYYVRARRGWITGTDEEGNLTYFTSSWSSPTAIDVTGSNGKKVSLTSTARTTTAGNMEVTSKIPAGYNGLELRVTSDRAGNDIVADEIVESDSAVLKKTIERDKFDVNKQYYLWIARIKIEELNYTRSEFAGPFAVGDKTKATTKVVTKKNKKGKVTGVTVTKTDTKGKKVKFTYRVVGKKKLELTKITGTKSDITIPATVKTSKKTTYKVVSIRKKACQKNKAIKSLTIGKNIQTIGTKAFYGAKNLKKVTLTAKNIKSIGKKSFAKINKKAKFTIKGTSKQKKRVKKLIKKSS